MPSIPEIATIMLAGGLGSVLRLYFARWHGRLPWGILLANILASFAVGALMHSQRWFEPILVIGLCGGLSTFSSVVAAAGEYFRAKEPIKAIAYGSINLVLPLLAVSGGAFMASGLLN